MTEIIANWSSGDGAAERTWSEKGLAGLMHLSVGGPDVNHLGLNESATRTSTAYSPATLDRLTTIKQTHDPHETFQTPPWINPSKTSPTEQ